MSSESSNALERLPSGGGVTAFAESNLFHRLYDQSMAMVRDAAEYLELEGVLERQQLSEKMSLVFACESMRVTTRLMQISAWLLAMRALSEGEISEDDIPAKGFRISAKEVCLGGPVRGAGLLPVRLIEMLQASRALYERVLRLDQILFERKPHQPVQNPVIFQQARLERAFGVI